MRVQFGQARDNAALLGLTLAAIVGSGCGQQVEPLDAYMDGFQDGSTMDRVDSADIAFGDAPRDVTTVCPSLPAMTLPTLGFPPTVHVGLRTPATVVSVGPSGVELATSAPGMADLSFAWAGDALRFVPGESVEIGSDGIWQYVESAGVVAAVFVRSDFEFSFPRAVPEFSTGPMITYGDQCTFARSAPGNGCCDILPGTVQSVIASQGVEMVVVAMGSVERIGAWSVANIRCLTLPGCHGSGCVVDGSRFAAITLLGPTAHSPGDGGR